MMDLPLTMNPPPAKRLAMSLGQIIKGLRGIEWVIFGLKTRESWGLQGNSAI
jgi:hypothetical protein